MSYKLVKAANEFDLAHRVSGEMAEGWQCQGSPQWSSRAESWIQAMTRMPAPPSGEIRLKEPKRK